MPMQQPQPMQAPPPSGQFGASAPAAPPSLGNGSTPSISSIQQPRPVGQSVLGNVPQPPRPLGSFPGPHGVSTFPQSGQLAPIPTPTTTAAGSGLAQPRTRLAGSAPTSPSNAGIALQFAGGGGLALSSLAPSSSAPAPPQPFTGGVATAGAGFGGGIRPQQFPPHPPSLASSGPSTKFASALPGGPSDIGFPPPSSLGTFPNGANYPTMGMPQGVPPPSATGPLASQGFQGAVQSMPLQPPGGAVSHQQQPPPQGMPRPGMAGGFPPPPTGFGAPPPPPLGHQQQQLQQQHYQQQPPQTPLSPSGGGGGTWGAPPSFGSAPGSIPQPGSAGGAVPAAQGMGGRNIDPGSMPRAPSQPPPTQVFETRRENTHTIPPPCDAPIVVRDYGSAGPRYMRSSLNSVPQGADLLKSSSVPFVVLINALAPQEPGDSPLEIIDPGPAGPMRCSGCKAYVCPYMRWGDQGRRMECCFCGANTVVPPEYFSHISGDGTRRDKDERPELCRGSVEFEVAGEYLVRPPVAPTFFFLIEVTSGAVSSGATAAACASVAQLLDELPGEDRTRVGIATFDSRVHFYAPRNGGDQEEAQPVMLVMSDAAEPFCPLGGASLAVSLAQHKPALKSLLESIPKTFAGSQVGPSAGGAALNAAIDGLKSGVGGRLVAFVSSLPQFGALSLRPREAGRPPSDRDTLDVMIPEGKAYTALAQDAAAHQVSIDLFILSQGYVDLASMSALATETSGSVYRYNPFTPAADGPRFHNDLRWCLTRPQAYEAVARLRVSSGLAVDSYVGAFHRRNLTDLHFPAVSCDHAIAARLIHEERLREGTEAYLQYALLYTSTEGRRRVRVHTLALPVTRSMSSVFRGADLDSYATYVARKVSAQLPGKTIVACREVVIKAAVDTLVAYRKHVSIYFWIFFFEK